MVQIPTADTLGSRTPVSNAQIATLNPRRIELPAQKAEEQGQVIENIGQKLNEADSQLDAANAKSYFLQQHVLATNAFQNDNDPDTYAKRYQEQMKDVQSNASAMIKDPMQRALFQTEMNTETSRGLENVQKQAQNKQADLGIASLDNTIMTNRQAALTAPDEPTAVGLLDATNQGITSAQQKGWLTATQAEQRRQRATQDYASGRVGMLPPEERITALQNQDSQLVKFIPADVNQSMQDQANNEIRKDQVGYRADLTARVKDSNSMAFDGVVDPNPPKHEDFVKAYGPEDAPAAQKEYQDGQLYAYSVYQLATMTPDKQKETLDKMAPKPGDGYAQQDQRYQAALKAVDSVNKQRATDPMQYGVDNGFADKDLSLADPHALADQLTKRAAVAESMAQDYGTTTNVFTKSEAAGISSMLNSQSAPQKLSYLKALRDGITDSSTYRQALQQIAPGSPVTAMAGGYLDLDKNVIQKNGWFKPDTTLSPLTVAERLTQGEALINPTEEDKKMGIKAIEMPKGKAMQEDFDTYAGNSFQNFPIQKQIAFEATKAYYAAMIASKSGSSDKYDSEVFKNTFKDVIGSKYDHNGDILLPWGMNENSFNAAAKPAFDSAMTKAGLDPNIFNYNHVGFQNTGDVGRYAITNGTSPLRDKNQNVIIMDLSKYNSSGDE